MNNKTAIKFNWTAHKALWLWLSRNPNKLKSQWPGWIDNGGNVKIVIDRCFCCQYTIDSEATGHNCNSISCSKYCPLIWPGSGECNYENGDLFALWTDLREEDLTIEVSEIALQIRNLPVRDGVIVK